MDDLRRFFETGGGFFDPRRDITPLQLHGLGLFLASAVTLGCLSFGLDPRTAFIGLIGLVALVVLTTALSTKGDRG
jgi:hypothetical protein